MHFLHSSIVTPAIVQLQHLPHLWLNNDSEQFEARKTMALATANTTNAQSGLGARFAGFVDHLQARRARRRIFNQTYSELAALSNRELADLGLARSEIRRVAWQAASES